MTQRCLIPGGSPIFHFAGRKKNETAGSIHRSGAGRALELTFSTRAWFVLGSSSASSGKVGPTGASEHVGCGGLVCGEVVGPFWDEAAL